LPPRSCAPGWLYPPRRRTTAAIDTTLYANLSFSFFTTPRRWLGFMSVPYVLEVTPRFGSRQFRNSSLTSKPIRATVDFASGGNGSGQHIAGEMFKMMTDTEMVHVPYRGGAVALIDRMARQVAFCAVRITAGRWRAVMYSMRQLVGPT
jgi:hypothetical protein